MDEKDIKLDADVVSAKNETEKLPEDIVQKVEETSSDIKDVVEKASEKVFFCSGYFSVSVPE